MKAKELWNKINENPQLQNLEIRGFMRGQRKGKTIDVSLGTMFKSLQKQWQDLANSYILCEDNKILKRRIADLRNVAGCLFLKIEEAEAK